ACLHRRAGRARRAPGAAPAGVHAGAAADLRGLSDAQAPLGQGAALRRVSRRALCAGAGLERGVNRILCFLFLWFYGGAALAVDWVIASSEARAQAGDRFELIVVAPP